MNLLVLTRAVKIDQSEGIPESGVPERTFCQKVLQAFPRSHPYPIPSLFVCLFVVFFAYIFLRLPTI